MEKEIKDFEKMTEKELLVELADRLVVEQKSKERMTEYLADRGWTSDDADEMDEPEWADLKMDNDEDWCRVRELVRFVKKDDTIWEC